MDTPERPRALPKTDTDDNVSPPSNAVASLVAGTSGSPRTPNRVGLNNLDDSYADEQESPQYSHLIPIGNRRLLDDLEDWDRIGWNDGCGPTDYDYDCGSTERRKKALMRWATNSMSMYDKLSLSPQNTSSSRRKYITNSPANNKKQQVELNDYMTFMLSCLMKKKKLSRKLLDDSTNSSENTAPNTTNTLVESGSMLDDSADDELMFLCSQAVENMAEQTYNTVNRPFNSKTVDVTCADKHAISIQLNNNNTMSSNNCGVGKNSNQPLQQIQSNGISPSGHIVKKFKQMNNNNYHNNTVVSSNLPLPNQQDNNTTVKSSPNLLEEEDDDLFFSSIDLAAIEKQEVSSKLTKSSYNSVVNNNSKAKPTATVHQNISSVNRPSNNMLATQIQYNTNNNSVLSKQRNNRMSNSGPHSLWRRSSSSSSICIQPSANSNTVQQELPDGIASQSSTTAKPNHVCTAAEIQEKQERARRKLLLKFKERNKSLSKTAF